MPSRLHGREIFATKLGFDGLLDRLIRVFVDGLALALDSGCCLHLVCKMRKRISYWRFFDINVIRYFHEKYYIQYLSQVTLGIRAAHSARHIKTDIYVRSLHIPKQVPSPRYLE